MTLRALLRLWILACCVATPTALAIGWAVRSQPPLLRLVPDTTVYLGAVCVEDSLGHARVRYYQQVPR